MTKAGAPNSASVRCSWSPLYPQLPASRKLANRRGSRAAFGVRGQAQRDPALAARGAEGAPTGRRLRREPKRRRRFALPAHSKRFARFDPGLPPACPLRFAGTLYLWVKRRASAARPRFALPQSGQPTRWQAAAPRAKAPSPLRSAGALHTALVAAVPAVPRCVLRVSAFRPVRVPPPGSVTCPKGQ